MTDLIHRRTFLRGLFAAPAIVTAANLMPIRGERLLGATLNDEYWLRYIIWNSSKLISVGYAPFAVMIPRGHVYAGLDWGDDNFTLALPIRTDT